MYVNARNVKDRATAPIATTSDSRIDAELKDRAERLKRTEARIKGLVGFIADGDRSEYVEATLRDPEVQAKAERVAIDRLPREAQQLLVPPSLDEITGAAPWLKDGEIRVACAPTSSE